MSCQLFLPNYRYSKTQKKHFFILLIDADGLFPRLIRSHGKATAIKAAGDKLLLNKFIRQNFGGSLTLKPLDLDRLGADFVET